MCLRTFGGWRRFVAIPAFLATLWMGACQAADSAISASEEEGVTRIGEPAVDELLRTLVGRLTSAMEEGGPEGAIEFCAEEALPLTRAVESGVPGGVRLKRTSFRYRNPENAPDEAEEQALTHFENQLLEGLPSPGPYVQKVSAEEFRYYRPLFLGEVCLQCHGNLEAMTPEVRNVLEDRYPGDLATGYSAGDFRGVVRVSVSSSTLSSTLGG